MFSEDKVLSKIELTIEKHSLLNRGESVLAALSGGADSVFLLNALLILKDKLNITVYAAHVNHGLRGADAESDELFCESFCKKNGVKLFVKKADVKKIAAETSVSEEVAGRNVRYAFFNEITEKYGIDKIATAHNSDDNAETVLMRFLRGTGVNGLCGIPYKNKNIIRPALDVSREEIEFFLSKNNIPFVTDKTNFEEIYTRNKIRLRLLPFIEKEINSGIKNTLLSNIAVYNKCEDFLKESENAAFNECVRKRSFYFEADIKKLLKKHEYVAGAVVKRIISELGAECSASAVCACINVLNGKTKKINISGKITAETAYGKMFFYGDVPKISPTKAENGVINIAETGKKIVFTKAEKICFNAGKNVFYADGDKLKNIYARSRKDGDFFYPIEDGTKKVKLKDFFINNKIPSFLRDTVPVLISENNVVWLAGLRHNVRFAANENTKNIMRIEVF